MADQKNIYNEKAEWLKKNIPILGKRVNNICQRCNCKTQLSNATIHHTQYTGHDYKKSLDKLLEHNAIKWVCKACHKLEHTAFKEDEYDQKIKNSGNCILCLKFTWKAWNTIPDLKIPICRKCGVDLWTREIIITVKEGSDPEIIAIMKDLGEELGDHETDDRKMTFDVLKFTKSKNLTDINRRLLELVLERKSSGIYGNAKASNKSTMESRQFDLFDD